MIFRNKNIFLRDSFTNFELICTYLLLAARVWGNFEQTRVAEGILYYDIYSSENTTFVGIQRTNNLKSSAPTLRNTEWRNVLSFKRKHNLTQFLFNI